MKKNKRVEQVSIRLTGPEYVELQRLANRSRMTAAGLIQRLFASLLELKDPDKEIWLGVKFRPLSSSYEAFETPIPSTIERETDSDRGLPSDIPTRKPRR